MFISVKLVDGSRLMVNPKAIAVVKWGNPTVISMISGQQISLVASNDNYELFQTISRDWEYESRIARR